MTNYRLLPFRFTRINGSEVLVNEVGDYLTVPVGTTSRIVNREISKKEMLYKDLVSRFFISPEPVPTLLEVYAARLRTAKSFLDRFTALHIFVPTLRCNANCGYCQASSLRTKSISFCDMTEEMMKRSVELMFHSPAPCLTMEFQGGEPTLAFPLIRYAVFLAERINRSERRRMSYVLCTNCMELTDEMIDFCRRFSLSISTSLDGPEWLHDANRGRAAGSYRKATVGMERARRMLGYDKVSALMTASRISLEHPHEIVDAYRANGFRRIFLRSLNPYGLALSERDWEDYTTRFLLFYKTAFEYILELNKAGECFVEDFAALILQKILTPFPAGYVDLQSPAGTVNSVILYHCDGKVYASDEARMLARQGDDRFCLGSVFDDYTSLFYGKKVQQLSRLWAAECLAGCSDCAWLPYCGADPVRHYAMQGDAYGYRPTSLFCRRNKAVIDYLFTLLTERGDEVLPVFRKWLRA